MRLRLVGRVNIIIVYSLFIVLYFFPQLKVRMKLLQHLFDAESSHIVLASIETLVDTKLTFICPCI